MSSHDADAEPGRPRTRVVEWRADPSPRARAGGRSGGRTRRARVVKAGGIAARVVDRAGGMVLRLVESVAQKARDAGPGTATGSGAWSGSGSSVGNGGGSRTLSGGFTRGWRARGKRLLLLFVIAQVIVFCDQWLLAPGGPVVEPSACQTVTGESVAGQSPAVVMARAQGEALRALASGPPDPAQTQAWAKSAADEVVVAVLALKAGARGQDEPSKVTAHESAAAERYQTEQAALLAGGCGTCPGATPGGPGSGSGEQPAPDVQEAIARTPTTGTAGSASPVACGTGTSTGQTAAGTGSSGAWGGYANGRIPASALCRPATHTNHLLRCDAADAIEALSAAYQAEFGTPLVITDAYRDYDSQVRTKAAKGNLAAKPGTSQHGWGLAVDLGGGIQSFGSTQHEWMRAHAGAFGWVHPGWAQAGGSKPEPWHWEYAGTKPATGASTTGNA